MIFFYWFIQAHNPEKCRRVGERERERERERGGGGGGRERENTKSSCISKAEHPNLGKLYNGQVLLFCLLWLTGLVPNSGIPNSEVTLYLTTHISKNDYRCKAIGRPLAEASGI